MKPTINFIQRESIKTIQMPYHKSFKMAFEFRI